MSTGLLLLLLACPAAEEAGRPARHGERQPAQPKLLAVETRLRERIAAARRRAGVRDLLFDPAIDALAREHSEALARRGRRASHRGVDDRFRRLRDRFGYRRAAENVAFSQGAGDPAATAVEGWLDSRSHRHNLLGDFDRAGIGAGRAQDGSWYFTLLLVDLPAPHSP